MICFAALLFIVFNTSLAFCASSSHSRTPSQKSKPGQSPFVGKTHPHAPLENIYDRNVAKKELETSRECRNLKQHALSNKNDPTHSEKAAKFCSNDHFAAADAEARQAKAYSDAYVKHYTDDYDVLPSPSHARFKATTAVTAFRRLQHKSEAHRLTNHRNAITTNDHHRDEDKKLDDRVIDSNLDVIRCKAIQVASKKKNHATSSQTHH